MIINSGKLFVCHCFPLAAFLGSSFLKIEKLDFTQWLLMFKLNEEMSGKRKPKKGNKYIADREKPSPWRLH